MTTRARAAIDRARQHLANAARHEHDHRHGDSRCPICNPATEEHWTDR